MKMMQGQSLTLKVDWKKQWLSLPLNGTNLAIGAPLCTRAAAVNKNNATVAALKPWPQGARTPAGSC